MVLSAFPQCTRAAALRALVAGTCFLSGLSPGCKNADPLRPAPAQQHRTVVIGLVPEKGIFSEASRYEVLARYLPRKTGYDIRATVFPRYDQVGAQIIARPEWKDCSSACQGLLIARKDSGIRSINAMKGMRFVFVDRDTTAGYLFPLAYFRKHGVDYRSWFRETYSSGTHADAIKDVLNRDADAGAVKGTMFERLAGEDHRVSTELLVLESSPRVPMKGLVVGNDLDPEVRERLTAALLSMRDDPGGVRALDVFGARRFIRTVDDDYRPVRDFARIAGVSLATGRERSGK